MDFKFLHTEKPEKYVSNSYIDSVEQKYGIKFPEVLRAYYSEHNGAVMEETPFVMHNIEFCVEFIIPLKHGNINVEKLLGFYKDDKYFPNGFIPLAEDTDGDDYYWDSNDGRVYYLSMGNADNPIPIARSVEEFFEILNASC